MGIIISIGLRLHIYNKVSIMTKDHKYLGGVNINGKNSWC